MATLVFAMNQSLDGYVDHDGFAPGPNLFRHFIGQTAGLAGSVYGRRMYEIMRYWDDDQDGWGPDEREYAVAWRKQPKWVVSSTLTSVGPNATLIEGDLEAFVRDLKARIEGEVLVAGTLLADSVGRMGLIDQFQIYLHPVVLGAGKPFFAGARPPLRLTLNEPIADGVIRLTYVPV
ncbi:MAG: dihydrofolate reductase family protein [Pseudomonadota bacterium]